MNPTYTIESVHGVKQTIVFGPFGDTDSARKEIRADREPSQSRQTRADCRDEDSDRNR